MKLSGPSLSLDVDSPEPVGTPQEVEASMAASDKRDLMTLKLTAERYAKRREEMMQRLTQGVREMFRGIGGKAKHGRPDVSKLNQAHFILHWYTSHRKLWRTR